MLFDFELTKKIYAGLDNKIKAVRKVVGRPLTLSEKILYAHLYNPTEIKNYIRGKEYADFAPDRVAMQDATAQMALLQFMIAGKNKVAVPSSVHCDHLIRAEINAQIDKKNALATNQEVYNFLQTVCDKYGIGFWQPGAGIIHQVVLENYAFPGGMMIGTDSHTPNAGGLGMIAIGVGGADAVDVMAGIPWELKMPQLIGVKLTGKLNGWTAPKDVILKLAGILTVKGATNAIIEYFGEGASNIPATGKATICNMGAEVGATTSIFPYDRNMEAYLIATGREKIAEAATGQIANLTPDPEVTANPELYYDKVIEIDLSRLEPHINGPFTPDAAYPISEFKNAVEKNGYPTKMEVGLIGSCTNSSYQDLSRAASIARQAKAKNLKAKSRFIVNPGSEQILATATRDGIINDFKHIGATIMANACGPCIGQWKRTAEYEDRSNSVVTSFNRNFAKRLDGNPNTHAFVASPEIVTALTLAGDLRFNPLTDTLKNENGEQVKLEEPTGDTLPQKGFTVDDNGYIAPSQNGEKIKIEIDPKSERLQKLQPFPPLNISDFNDMPLLIKVSGKCTTDHISMAGAWLKFRGHLENISDNLLMGALNSFNGKTNNTLNTLNGTYEPVSTVAKAYKKNGISSVVVAEENYGEGSSREHAALEPRFLNVKAIIAKSFARIHETNLKKQGILALTFANKDDYAKIRETDRISVNGLETFEPGKELEIEIKHSDGSIEKIAANHTYNTMQIKWFEAGSALNYLSKQRQTWQK